MKIVHRAVTGAIWIVATVSITAASAAIFRSAEAGERYTITDPYNPMNSRTLRQVGPGHWKEQSTFNPTQQRTIRTRPNGDTVIYDTFNPTNRRIIRKR